MYNISLASFLQAVVGSRQTKTCGGARPSPWSKPVITAPPLRIAARGGALYDVFHPEPRHTTCGGMTPRRFFDLSTPVAAHSAEPRPRPPVGIPTPPVETPSVETPPVEIADEPRRASASQTRDEADEMRADRERRQKEEGERRAARDADREVRGLPNTIFIRYGDPRPPPDVERRLRDAETARRVVRDGFMSGSDELIERGLKALSDDLVKSEEKLDAIDEARRKLEDQAEKIEDLLDTDLNPNREHELEREMKRINRELSELHRDAQGEEAFGRTLRGMIGQLEDQAAEY